MRILLDYRPALRQRTGVGEYAHQLARALTETSPGPQEELLLFSASWKDRLDPNVIPGARVVDRRLPNRLLNFAWHRLGWPPAEQVGAPNLDLVHAFHPLLIPSRRAAQVVTINDLDFLDHAERTAREIRRDYASLAPSHAKRAHRVIVISQTMAREAQNRLGVPAERLTVCTPGAPSWTPRETEPAAGCILFLGTLEARKNLGVLVDAYERLLSLQPDAPPLVLAGKHTDSAADLVARAGRPPLAGHVEFPGYVEDETRQALYRRAIVFVMPSHMEGFGMPVLEAMTVGVPCVVADRGALPEVGGRAARRFEPDDAGQLAAVLSELLASPGVREAMRQEGWAQSRAFSWHSSAARLRDAWTLAVAARREAHA